MDPSALAALVAAILGAGGLGAFATYRKAGKEAEDIAARTLIAVNDELRTELGRLRHELERRDREITSLRERVAALEAMLTGGP